MRTPGGRALGRNTIASMVETNDQAVPPRTLNAECLDDADEVKTLCRMRGDAVQVRLDSVAYVESGVVAFVTRHATRRRTDGHTEIVAATIRLAFSRQMNHWAFEGLTVIKEQVVPRVALH